MIKNHLKIAWRNVVANPMFSAINILGLSLSLAITTLLFLFIYHENSFNEMYTNKGQIFRVTLQTGESYNNTVYANAPAMVGPTAAVEIPEVINALRVYKHGFGDPAYIGTKNNSFIETGLYYADPSLCTVFEIDLLNGNKDNALKNPNTAIISERTAERFFGTSKVLGQSFSIDDNKTIEITGVFRDLPTNSTLDGNVYVSMATSFFSKNPSWSNASLETYLLTTPNTNAKVLDKKMQEMLDKNVPEEGRWYSLKAQPFDQVHLYSSHIQNGYSSRKGSIDQVSSLSWLAFLILIIACINYMNLATARSQKRSREVGVSKTLGASKSSLIRRFYTETGLVTFISIILGVFIAILSLPYFNKIAGKEIPSDLLLSGIFILSLVAIWLVATLLAGSYPALYMSSFSAKKVLNGDKGGSFWTISIRRGLVVLQFVASTILIVGVYVIYSQLNYIQQKDLGFTTERVVAVSINGVNDQNKVALLKEQLLQLPEVTALGAAQGYPGKNVSGRMIQHPLEDDGGLAVQTNRADAEALDVLQLRLLAGKNLPSVKAKGDTLVEVVVNKRITDYLGYEPAEAIGQKISMLPGENEYIVGVVDNFHYASLREPIGAYAFHNLASEYKEFLLLKLTVSDLSQHISRIQDRFQTVVDAVPFDYSFMDQNIEKLYIEEKQTASIGMIFSILAVFVACLGLFGLAAFTAEQRDKEIGIRKVLGASVLGITKLLSIDFINLICIALLIAFPLSYYIMNNWLQEFAYRIHIGWTPFVFTALFALLVAIMTVSFQSIKAALRNPITALRKE